MSKDLKQVLENQLSDYHKERREFWLMEFPLLALICVVVCFGLSYLGHRYVGEMIADWRIVASLSCIVVLIPPIKMMAPKKPNVESAAYDDVLRQIGAKLREQQSSR